ncbi:MAG TPA: hypothetical protein VFS51_09940, partial [Gemmatimonadales bacterium]|nr:hypothetical protein [Gemmatimonadales bacterium]
MISRHGPQPWSNVHVTVKAQVSDLLDIDNSAPAGTPQPSGFAALRQAARDLDSVIQDARRRGKRIRALGSG